MKLFICLAHNLHLNIHLITRDLILGATSKSEQVEDSEKMVDVVPRICLVIFPRVSSHSSANTIKGGQKNQGRSDGSIIQSIR